MKSATWITRHHSTPLKTVIYVRYCICFILAADGITQPSFFGFETDYDTIGGVYYYNLHTFA